MQVTPSNNLLNALSGLQANRRPTPAGAGAAAGAASFQAAVQQAAGTEKPTGPTTLSAVANQPVQQAAAAQPAQPRRGQFLGQHLDITV